MQVYVTASLSSLKGWAQRKRPTDVVGYARRSDRCPVASFVKERELSEAVVVCLSAMAVGDTQYYIQPEVAKLIEKIDHDYVFTAPITASDLLRLIEQVEGKAA